MSDTNWNTMLGRIREELSSLATFIDKTRKGIDTLESTVKVGSERFPEASSQLSAVTGDLENAANNIMSILEGLMTEQERTQSLLKSLSDWAGKLPEEDRKTGAAFIVQLEGINQKTKSEMMDIFTNMSFHDLSGQKLKKVIGSLAVVETKLLELALNFGLKENQEGEEAPEFKTPKIAMTELPINQDIVDKLLKELGA